MCVSCIEFNHSAKVSLKVPSYIFSGKEEDLYQLFYESRRDDSNARPEEEISNAPGAGAFVLKRSLAHARGDSTRVQEKSNSGTRMDNSSTNHNSPRCNGERITKDHRDAAYSAVSQSSLPAGLLARCQGEAKG